MKKMINYEEYLKENGYSNHGNNSLHIPKEILLDKNLTEKEKLSWIILASQIYGSNTNFFRGYYRLKELLRIHGVQEPSDVVQKLQDKKYLKRYYDKSNHLSNDLFFRERSDKDYITALNLRNNLEAMRQFSKLMQK
jgi:hypothetical protein